MTAQIYELGDSALTIEFGNEINKSVHQEVMKRFYQFQSFPLPGTLDLIPAYASLTIVFDLGVVASRFEGLAGMKNLIEKKLAEDFTGHLPEGRLHEIPCEYVGADLSFVAKSCGLSEQEIIRIHSEKEYTVYFLGFLPGFAYMGTTDARITVARKETPAPIQQGDIGLAGNQTGIYPSASPGGWQIIGRTKNIPHFRAGDRVRFIPVTI
ncbi:MAG: 5-oxoprolinase subunit PxpB [Bacteroidota bacterium]|jgi:inhibitor of KinA